MHYAKILVDAGIKSWSKSRLKLSSPKPRIARKKASRPSEVHSARSPDHRLSCAFTPTHLAHSSNRRILGASFAASR